ncbi:frizzled-5-like isoform X3 [Varroa destructor]|nr:frizzled-5-like isoform X3 [Varroa destructor]XP_022671195.1 frizzled-5-like isoform X3 [Varroa destructor]XP_022671196.1 frizzled-5-like isoform X3 [Varroa destructor]
MRCLVITIAATVAATVTTAGATPAVEERCEEIVVPMCKGIGYNRTRFPNAFNQDTQDEAGLEVHQFWPLVEIQCSEDLRFFLCSIYTPICIEGYQGKVPACKSVCERAKVGCAPIMQQYGFSWPDRMDCELFPEYGDPVKMCMDSKEGERPKKVEEPRRGGKKLPAPGIVVTDVVALPPPGGIAGNCSCYCQSPMVNTLAPSFKKFGKLKLPQCAQPCRNMYFSKDDQLFTYYWLLLWSVVCLASSSTTILSGLIDSSRFPYPERPVIYISLCYFFISIGYLLGIYLGNEQLACDGALIRYSILSNLVNSLPCLTVFSFTYYFIIVSSLWWVVLSMTWYLSAALKWSSEAISGYAVYFHMFAWFSGAGIISMVVYFDAIDGDSVSGLCFVGSQNSFNLTVFLIIPLCTALGLGVIFLLIGFTSLFKIRKIIKAQGQHKAEKFEKLIVRIGVYSILYALPSTIVVGCLFYERNYKEVWMHKLTCPCEHADSAWSRPSLHIFVVKHFMFLVAGITSGFWICSGKTLNSWWRYFAAGSNPHRPHINPISPHLDKHGSLGTLRTTPRLDLAGTGSIANSATLSNV